MMKPLAVSCALCIFLLTTTSISMADTLPRIRYTVSEYTGNFTPAEFNSGTPEDVDLSGWPSHMSTDLSHYTITTDGMVMGSHIEELPFVYKNNVFYSLPYGTTLPGYESTRSNPDYGRAFRYDGLGQVLITRGTIWNMEQNGRYYLSDLIASKHEIVGLEPLEVNNEGQILCSARKLNEKETLQVILTPFLATSQPWCKAARPYDSTISSPIYFGLPSNDLNSQLDVSAGGYGSSPTIDVKWDVNSDGIFNDCHGSWMNLTVQQLMETYDIAPGTTNPYTALISTNDGAEDYITIYAKFDLIPEPATIHIILAATAIAKRRRRSTTK